MASIAQTIEQVAGSIMSQMQLSIDKRRLIRGHLIDFLIEYRNDVKALIDVFVVSPVPQSLIIPFPSGYIDYSKVGWVVDGMVKIVAENQNIAKNLTLNQSGIFRGWPTAIYNNPGGQPVPSQINGYMYNNMYGQRGGTGTISGAIIPELKGFFKEDWENKCFRLSTVNAFPNFYLEYVSDCFEPTDCTIIHPYAYAAAKAFAIYNYLRFSYEAPAHKVDRAARELDNEIIKMNRRLKRMSAIDIISSYDQWQGANE